MYTIGPQKKDESKSSFIAIARLHQSHYRAEVLKVDYIEHGNKLTEKDGRKLLNYYDDFGIRELKHKRFPNYSKNRDGNLLNSEHIPFNFFGPLTSDYKLAKKILTTAFDIECDSVLGVNIEYKPKNKPQYLNDSTSFDVYIQAKNKEKIIGIGIEVKYSEGPYKKNAISKEMLSVNDKNSPYWQTTIQSKAFIDGPLNELASDNLRQIWRNHLLGLSMVLNKDIHQFYAITLFPQGNQHFDNAISSYRTFLRKNARDYVKGVHYEDFIAAINGDDRLIKWRDYLTERYIIS